MSHSYNSEEQTRKFLASLEALCAAISNDRDTSPLKECATSNTWSHFLEDLSKSYDAISEKTLKTVHPGIFLGFTKSFKVEIDVWISNDDHFTSNPVQQITQWLSRLQQVHLNTSEIGSARAFPAAAENSITSQEVSMFYKNLYFIQLANKKRRHAALPNSHNPEGYTNILQHFTKFIDDLITYENIESIKDSIPCGHDPNPSQYIATLTKGWVITVERRGEFVSHL